MGILTGKFTPATRFGEDDFRRRWHEDAAEHATFLSDLEKVEALRPLSVDSPLTQLALRFSVSHPAVSVSIPGAKTPSQLRENLRAALLPPLTPAELAAIDRIVLPGGGRKIWPA
jgi:aryl-alcohol dehydrogenase-like predicted oxidoreductase